MSDKKEIKKMVVNALRAHGITDLEHARSQYFALGGEESDIGPRHSVDWYRRRALILALHMLNVLTDEI